MNKNIAYLVEYGMDVIGFNPQDLDDNEDPKRIISQDDEIMVMYKYAPKTTEELDQVITDMLSKGQTDLNCIYTGYITDFSYLFQRRYNLPNELDISCWDVSNGKYFRHMFYNCQDLKVDVSLWNVSNGIDFECMFYNCKKMEGDFRNWDFSNAKRMNKMFYNCRRILLEPEKYVEDGLTYFPETNEELKKLVNRFLRYDDTEMNCIDVSQITDFHTVFWQKDGIHNLKIDKWNVSNGVIFRAMFKNCLSFNANLTKWDVSRGEDFSQMFANCHQFNSNIKNWNVSNGVDFHAMFWGCNQLKADLTKWDLSNADDVKDMFYEANTDLFLHKKPKSYNAAVSRITNQSLIQRLSSE